MMTGHLMMSLVCLATFWGCNPKKEVKLNTNIERAQQTLDSLYKYYSAPKTFLLRENYPFDASYTATYLASDEQANVPNQYSYLWPYSGTFSALNALYDATRSKKYQKMLDSKVLPGLDEYLDDRRQPPAYSSYIRKAPKSDRFYDDNVWLGIDFTDAYQMTGKKEYVDKARMIWSFIASGIDDQLGGGIYWCEQKKESKNTCSNAPGAVFALKLFEATKDSTYFAQGKKLYEWTQKHLQDSTDFLYYDNIRLDGRIGKAKYAYNSGQMMQAAALLYKLTENEMYLKEAQNIAKSCYIYFFNDFATSDGRNIKIFRKGDIWFTAVMLRGFIELYNIDGNPFYMNGFRESLNFAWNKARAANGLFNAELNEDSKDNKKWLLTQAAMVEMYARIATVK